MQKKNYSGITLIALVITIIILLILAGVTISLVLGNNGILTRAEDSVRISKIKEIEELARLSYMDRQIGEIDGGEKATIAGVINDLKEQGYNIKEKLDGNKSITSIEVNKEQITVKRNTTGINTYTFVYSGEEKQRYFVEVQGKDYEIFYENGEITISTEATNIDEMDRKTEVIVESSDNNIIEAKILEEGKIQLIAKNVVGDVEITIRETGGVTKTFNATTRVPATGLSITPNPANVAKGTSQQLKAVLQPNDTTDEITWTSSNTNIVEISNTGLMTAKNDGTATITATLGEKTATCNVGVYVKLESISVEDIKIKYGEPQQLNVTTTPNVEYLEELTYKVDNSTYATVDTNGLLTLKAGVKIGSTFTVTVSGKYSTDVKDTCNVRVISNPYDVFKVMETVHLNPDYYFTYSR